MPTDDNLKGSFYQGRPEKSIWRKIGKGLQAFGEGYAGRGMQFAAQEQENRQRERNELMRASISDAKAVNRLLSDSIDIPASRAGTIDYADPLASSVQALSGPGIQESVDILNDRISLLRERGQDDSDTLRIRDRILQGDIKGAQTEIGGFLRQAKDSGYIPKPEFLEVTKDGRILQRDPLTGEIEVADLEGVDPMSVAPATYQALRMRAADAGLRPGTPEFQNFMRLGGRDASSSGITKYINGTTVQTTGDGRKIVSVPGRGILPGETPEDLAAINQAVEDGMASGVEVAGAEAFTTTVQADRATSLSSQMNTGLEIADTLPILNRTMELLQEIDTGGINAVKLRAKQLFGVEGADEGQLSANLGTAVLSRLRETFGAQFTEREGARLERISAGIGSSNETNIRLIQQAIDLATRAAYRGIDAAEELGDSYMATSIQDAMRFTLGDDGLSSYFGVSQGPIQELPVIPDGAEGDALFEALAPGDEYIDSNGNRVRK